MTKPKTTKYSKCTFCNEIFIYKKQEFKKCLIPKTIYLLRCPHCDSLNYKKNLKRNQLKITTK